MLSVLNNKINGIVHMSVYLLIERRLIERSSSDKILCLNIEFKMLFWNLLPIVDIIFPNDQQNTKKSIKNTDKYFFVKSEVKIEKVKTVRPNKT